MTDRASLLHTPVVPSSDDAAAVDEHRADGDAALTQALFGLGDGSLKELVSRTVVHGRSISAHRDDGFDCSADPSDRIDTSPFMDQVVDGISVGLRFRRDFTSVTAPTPCGEPLALTASYKTDIRQRVETETGARRLNCDGGF